MIDNTVETVMTTRYNVEKVEKYNVEKFVGTLKMRDMKMRETRWYGTPRVAYVCPLPSRNAWVDKKEQIVLHWLYIHYSILFLVYLPS